MTHIDDEDVSFSTVKELEFLVERLGDEGFECVGEIMTLDFKDKFAKVTDVTAAKN